VEKWVRKVSVNCADFIVLCRFYCDDFSIPDFTVSVREEKVTKLSPKNERRYAKIIEDIKKGKNVTKTKNVDELLKLLRS